MALFGYWQLFTASFFCFSLPFSLAVLWILCPTCTKFLQLKLFWCVVAPKSIMKTSQCEWVSSICFFMVLSSISVMFHVKEGYGFFFKVSSSFVKLMFPLCDRWQCLHPCFIIPRLSSMQHFQRVVLHSMGGFVDCFFFLHHLYFSHSCIKQLPDTSHQLWVSSEERQQGLSKHKSNKPWSDD